MTAGPMFWLGVTGQLPTTLHWLEQLIAETSLDFNLSLAADAFAELLSTICAMIAISSEANDYANS